MRALASTLSRRLTETPLVDQDDVELLDGGTLSFTLAGPIQDADALIVVDAAQLKSAPGTLQVFQGEAYGYLPHENPR